MENEIEELNDRIARLEETNAEYRQRYGTGTRPAWVGEEIGINMMYIEIAKRQIAALKGEGQ
jgi:tetrahydromethanopterin S-methyltransferase subunit G